MVIFCNFSRNGIHYRFAIIICWYFDDYIETSSKCIEITNSKCIEITVLDWGPVNLRLGDN